MWIKPVMRQIEQVQLWASAGSGSSASKRTAPQ
jgi:hypothetical protein